VNIDLDMNLFLLLPSSYFAFNLILSFIFYFLFLFFYLVYFILFCVFI